MTSEEIQAIVDSLPSIGGEVVVPAGIHRLSRPIRLPANKSIKFNGQGAATELVAEFASAPVLIIEGPYGGDRAFSKSVGHLKISRSREYVKKGDTEAVGLLIDSVAYIIVHDLHLTHQECGIKFQGDSGNATIRDCWFLQLVEEGVRIVGGANYTIERCFIEPNNVGILLDKCEAVWIRDCKIINGGGYEYGIVVRGERHVAFNIVQCILEGARHSSIFFEDGIDRSSIKDCWIGQSFPRQDGGGGNGIKLDAGCSRISISRNRIGDQHGAAIELYRSHGLMIDQNLFDGNGRDANAPVIYLSNSKEVRILQNRFEGGKAIAALQIGDLGGPSSSIYLEPNNDLEQFSGKDQIG
ncbi:right-handed parallel beta-helix repeat-containing protein [Paenibacillus peoriae]|uniref:right-handed parallel beta-helix repeat-containing protein n=1 Tax=Paenibacillus peoriae TaxID=59893 RepID=UPI003F944D99